MFEIERNYLQFDIFIMFTGHIGSNDTELTPNHMNAIQSQMQSKGGYEMNSLRIQVKLSLAMHFSVCQPLKM